MTLVLDNAGQLTQVLTGQSMCTTDGGSLPALAVQSFGDCQSQSTDLRRRQLPGWLSELWRRSLTLSPQLGPQAAYVQHSSQTSPQGAAQIFVMAPQVSSSMNPCRHRLDIRSYMLKISKGFSGVVARCCCISLFSRRAAHDSTANNDLLTKPPWIEQDQAATVTPKARTRCTCKARKGSNACISEGAHAGADQGAETAVRCPVNVHSVGMCRTME